MFGDYMTDDQIYDEVMNVEELKNRIQYFLDDYNSVSKTPMDLVLFKYILEHVSRVARVLKQDAGHCLLVGMLSTFIFLLETSILFSPIIFSF